MKHTHGSWKYSFCDTAGYDCMYGGFEVTGHNEQVVCEIDLRNYDQEPCIYELPERFKEAQANARLIAAAPELLEALEQIALWSKDGPTILRDIALKAISNAKGKTP